MGSVNRHRSDAPYLASSLQGEGYIGATGRTPFRPVTGQTLEVLRELYEQPPLHGVQRVIEPGAQVISVLLDGTHNNGWFPAPGESSTNVFQLARHLKEQYGEDNAIYLPGIGAPQGMPGAERPDQPAEAVAALPQNAGPIAQSIIERAYESLNNRVQAIREQDPQAPISINLVGFSRGGAQAVALANLIDERGLPGLYEPGQTRIDTLLPFDPVDMTNGALDTRWPRNVVNSLVPVALGENRYIMPAMPLGPEARVVGIPEAAHADVGGSFNPQGIQAVTLGLARDFLSASGMDLPELPPHLQPDWSQMWAHESSLDNYGNRLWSVHGSERYFEGADRTAPTLPERLRQQGVSPEHQAWLDKARQELGPHLQAAGFSAEMCERIVAGCVCQVAGQAAAGAPAPRFLLARDQQRLGVLHPSGVLQEMRLDEVLRDPGALAVGMSTLASTMARDVPAMAAPVMGR